MWGADQSTIPHYLRRGPTFVVVPAVDSWLGARDCGSNGTSLCQAAGDTEETDLLNLGGVRGLQS